MDSGGSREEVKVGGVRSGEAMVLTGRGAERVNANADGGAQCANAGTATGG
jgi:hypothetical protein